MKTDRLVMGILAHVDAGKTTLAEGILYKTGRIREPGRVDHQNAFLDNFALERARGITIFSKQAEVVLGDRRVTLMDTPGHVDFSAEMERTLMILDYAILVISGADGVQGHVETLWRLLNRYEIPVFLFVNKMDQPGTDRAALMQELTGRLDSRCVDFSAIGSLQGQPEDFVQNASGKHVSDRAESGQNQEEVQHLMENLAMCDEDLLEHYLAEGEIPEPEIVCMIAERRVFPCYFGSALRQEGIEELLEGIRRYAGRQEYPETFGARIFKITRDGQGSRLTHMKITGGSLKVKQLLRGRGAEAEETAGGAAMRRLADMDCWEQKADQIRIYSGEGFEAVQEAEAGTVCAVTGLEYTRAGEGIGSCPDADLPLLEPVLSYRIELPDGCDVHRTFLQLRQLEEEIPELHIVWDEQFNEIHGQLMGEVQTEVLRSIIQDRFGIAVTFGEGSIVYRETIAEPVEGVGHFEPLRHYAEVHLLMEPLERGSGLQFAADCSEDQLARNWQRLILTHLEEKQHRGVLTGSEITDMKITLVAGRAHQKHTEGGDFRQATYRAVRHGLKCARSILLEPVYAFRLELPQENVGRALADIQRMHGKFEAPVTQEGMAVITGEAPVVTMRGYQMELMSYSRGRGRLQCTLKGYEECHNAEEVIQERGYDSELDLDNPTGSVFCSHGAGYIVPWDLVHEFAHVESGLGLNMPEFLPEEPEPEPVRFDGSFATGAVDENELKAIFERTYGKREDGPKKYAKSRRVEAISTGRTRPSGPQEQYLLVDGYNIIFAWEDLSELAKNNIDAARDRLMDILCNYQGYRKMNLILVFDAYKVPGGQGEVMKYHNIHVVYTREAETADQYIEKTVRQIGKNHRVCVATSDALEQVIIMGAGAIRMSAKELQEEILSVQKELREAYIKRPTGGTKTYLFDGLSEEKARLLKKIEGDGPE